MSRDARFGTCPCGRAELVANDSPPAGLTQQQFDALVEAISNEVVKKMKAAPAETPPPAQAKTEAPLEQLAEDERESIELVTRAGGVAARLPDFFKALASIPGELAPPTGGPRTLGHWFLVVVVAAGIAIAVEGILLAAFQPLRRRLASTISGTKGIGALLLLAALDGVALLAVWIAVHSLAAAWFSGTDPQSHFGTAVLTGVFAWRFYMFAFRVCFRPGLSAARLAETSDVDAREIYAGVGAAIAFVLVVRVVMRHLVAMGEPLPVVASGQLITSPLIVAVFIAIAVLLRQPVARWLRGLSRREEPGPVVTALSTHWLVIAIPFFLLLGGTQMYGAIFSRFEVPAAVVLTLNIVIGLLLLETVIDRGSRLLQHKAEVTGDHRPRATQAVARCIRGAIFIAAFVMVANAWLDDVFGLVRISGSEPLARTAGSVALILFGAFCAWEAVKFATARYVASSPASPAAGPEQHDHDDGVPGSGTSRLATLMPLMRVALGIVIAVLAVLTVLSQFGFNVTALIAGASVVGLAISFGSQTLVKDIVSGVFYLVDDAFRVGEYIDCGKAKGTVEGFTLRSLKLRHQNGQVYTVPFGQLGQITNFSRDWTTMKFNLRFARDTDLEKLRKAVKKIGQEMLEDPELKEEILVPLKMQGVADIADNAIVVRFKFTVRPSKPTFVHRDALKRMFRVLPEQGIEFANAMVAVQTLGAGGDAAASGAAAHALQAKAKAAADAAAAAAAES